jgi:hypothetical protein
MKAEITGSLSSLLKQAVYFNWIALNDPVPELQSSIDTCRYLLENTQLDETIDWMEFPCTAIDDPWLAEWLLFTGTSYMYGGDVAILTGFCIRELVLQLHSPSTRNDALAILKKFLISSSMQPAEPETINWLFEMDWLHALFEPLPQFEHCPWMDLGEPLSQLESFDVGKVLIDLLLALDVDVKLFMAEQQEKYPKQKGDSTDFFPRYDIIFEYIEGSGWILGFEWRYDVQDPGFLVVSEYSIMATDAQVDNLCHWPYALNQWDRSTTKQMHRLVAILVKDIARDFGEPK